MRTISRDELISLLAERPGAFPISFVARTKVRLNKRHRETKEPCPFAGVEKIAEVRGWVNCSWANACEKEFGEPFVPVGTWHDAALDIDQRLTPFSEDPRDGRLYLRVMRPVKLSEVYTDGLTAEQLAPYLPPPAKEHPVGFRTYGMETIISITFGGETYEVIGLASALTEAEKILAESMNAA